MERVASDSVVEKVPTFLEQLSQRRLQAKERAAQKKKEDQKIKEQEWQDYLAQHASPLMPGSKELDYALQWSKEKILSKLDQIPEARRFSLNLLDMNLKQTFSNWPVLAEPYKNMHEARFLQLALTNLSNVLKTEGAQSVVGSGNSFFGIIVEFE